MLSSSEMLDHFRKVIQKRNLSYKTEEAYLGWVFRFHMFCNLENPHQYTDLHVNKFLTFLDNEKKMSASTINQALNALSLFFREVLGNHETVFHTRNINRNIIVVTKVELKSILFHLENEQKLMVSLLYGSGLRLSECFSLRVSDLNFNKMEIIVYENNREEYRVVPLPKCLKDSLQRQVIKVKFKFEDNITKEDFAGAQGVGKENFQFSGKEFDSQFLFPSDRLFCHSNKLWQHHKEETYLQKAVKNALIKCQINKRISCNSFRHSFAYHLLENGYSLVTIQKLLGQKHINSTRIYKQLLAQNIKVVKSPLDELYD
jgi:site-specific recombinase XerD